MAMGDHETHALTAYSKGREVTVCEILDRVLDKGAVLTGEIFISVADIELLYVGINILVSSVETLFEAMQDGKWIADYLSVRGTQTGGSPTAPACALHADRD